MTFDDYKEKTFKNNPDVKKEYDALGKTPYCAITEQGDLGLGAEVLSEQDQQFMNDNK